MTVDHQSHKGQKHEDQNHNNKIGQGSLFKTLTLVFAGMAFLFAVFSIVLGNHLSTLHADHLDAISKNKSLATASVAEMQTALENAQTDLETAQQEAVAEKKNANKITEKLTTVHKELEKAKADLEAANQTIAALKTVQPAKPATAGDAPPQEALPITGPGTSSPPALPQQRCRLLNRRRNRQISQPSQCSPTNPR